MRLYKHFVFFIYRMKLEVKKSLEIEVRNLKSIVAEKDNHLATLNKQLEIERDEKMQLLEEKDHSQEDWVQQKQVWRMENIELRKQIDQMIEMAKNAEMNTNTRIERTFSEVETYEINEAYQRAIKEKEIIENENYMLKEELSRHQKPNGTRDNNQHSRSVSNASSQNEDDVGYVSAKNTLELRRHQGGENVNQISPETFITIGTYFSYIEVAFICLIYN